MKKRRFLQVDVFTDKPCLGNPVAVVVDADDLSDEAMQTIARWTNLSETTFLLPATDEEADYRVRIFTPKAELPFAGHPTLGSAFAAVQVGLIKANQQHWVQQCKVGLIQLSGDGKNSFQLRVPPAQFRALDAAQIKTLLAGLGISEMMTVSQVSLGPSWITAQLASAQQVLSLTPDQAVIARLSEQCSATGVTVFAANEIATSAKPAAAGYEVRSFAPAHGVDEDPVCGSGNGAVALMLRQQGLVTDYQARQGRAIGRDGFIQVSYRDEATFIGGQCVAVVEGLINY